ncbi:hypothetical protein Vretimale_15724 [Volvox reticuliferus]|uniref:Uncharacterized protein n=1 Tax=Volvox reticuliferus TaxID=1737510 RepID=A0A8J4LWI5_9CHLO|nr:hypothetical protein Vretimale_15724 [Volvox reticuliferus]
MVSEQSLHGFADTGGEATTSLILLVHTLQIANLSMTVLYFASVKASALLIRARVCLGEQQVQLLRNLSRTRSEQMTCSMWLLRRRVSNVNTRHGRLVERDNLHDWRSCSLMRDELLGMKGCDLAPINCFAL